MFYRFLSRQKGIYEIVDRDCPRDDERRQNKPDGSWLPKVGVNYPGAISFWTDFGVKKYIESGLMKWHTSVVKDPVTVVIVKLPQGVLYKDEYQIIVKPEEITLVTELSLEDFLKGYNL